jgi:hypothetical protein
MYEDLPKSLSEAKKVKSRYYFTGQPCVHGHIDRRKVSGGCYRCWRIYWNNRNRELVKAGRMAIKAAKKDLERPLICDPL